MSISALNSTTVKNNNTSFKNSNIERYHLPQQQQPQPGMARVPMFQSDESCKKYYKVVVGTGLGASMGALAFLFSMYYKQNLSMAKSIAIAALVGTVSLISGLVLGEKIGEKYIDKFGHQNKQYKY